MELIVLLVLIRSILAALPKERTLLQEMPTPERLSTNGFAMLLMVLVK